jgi:predicted aldo/keto reductase-like oxidoreductase
MKRRTFLKVTSGAAGGCMLGQGTTLLAGAAAEATNTMPRRALGKTGLQVSVITFPGLALSRATQEEANKAVRSAIERGVIYFDVAPAYGDSETKLGIALEGIDRSKIILSCKTRSRDKATAQRELDRSLQRLKTDYFDVYQMHLLATRAEVKQALGEGGAIEVFTEAKKQGKAKHIGITAHTSRAALDAINGFDFETVMFPINFIEYYLIGFGRDVLEAAQKKGMGVMGMKTISGGQWPQGMQRTRNNWYRPLEEPEIVNLAVRWTLSQPQVATAVPTGFIDLFDKVAPVGPVSKPITEAEIARLQELAKTCVSQFQREEQGVAMHQHYYDCPHFVA